MIAIKIRLRRIKILLIIKKDAWFISEIDFQSYFFWSFVVNYYMCKIISFFSTKEGHERQLWHIMLVQIYHSIIIKKVLVIDTDSQMNLTASTFGLSDTIECSEKNNKI